MAIYATPSRHLRFGDIVTEPLYGMSAETRKIQVETVTRGETLYRGEVVPVYYVTGRDISRPVGKLDEVKLTKALGYRWAMSREVSAPVPA
jgi:hypothetical protein